VDFPSYTTLFQTARAKALMSNKQLTRTAIDREGSDVNILVATGCAAAEQVVSQLVIATTGLFLDSANGEALDRLLFDRFGLTRKVAAQALGSVTFTLPTAAVAPFTIPAQTQLATPSGTKYETIEAELFPAGATSKYVSVRSLLAGTSQQAAIGTITNLLSAVPGSPAGLAVTNPIATAGAADRESDADFRERGRQFFTTARRGTLASLVQGALAVPGVVRAAAFELLDSSGRANRFVSLVIADQYTDALATLSTSPPSYAAQSKVLAQQVFNSLQDYRAAGIFVQVQVASVQLLPVSLSLSFRAGVDIDTVANNARVAVVNFLNNLNPGSDVTNGDIQAALNNVPGLYITGSEVISPIGTVVTTPLQVLRTQLALVRALSSNPNTPIGSSTNPDGP